MALNVDQVAGGYHYDLLDPLPDRFLCNICHLPSRNPYLSVCCGHLFCKSCLEYARKVAIKNICPVCRNEEFLTFPNKAVDREIKFLRVYCTNKMVGCEWQGELNDIKNHLRNSDGCQFELVICSNYCGKMLQRRYLTGHVRIACECREVNCQYCHFPGEHWFIESQHKSECPKFPLPCPNKCEIGTVPREDMKKHRAKCQLEVIDCSNCCGQKFERQYLSSHAETECPRRKVRCRYCHYTAEHQFVEGRHKRKCPKVPLTCPNHCEAGTILREDMEAHRKECPLEIIQCKYYDVGCEITMARKDQEKHKKENIEEHLIRVNFALKRELDGTKFELTNTRQDLIDATVALADAKCKLTDTSRQLTTALQRINTLEALVYLTMDKAAAMPTSSAALIESSLGWSVKLTAMTMMSKAAEQVCPVILKVSNYNEAMKNNHTWCSNFFYTDENGYRMCMRIIPRGHGSGKGSHLSCYLYLSSGPYDDKLFWPFTENFEIKLLNQISDSQHHSTFVTYYNGYTGRGANVNRVQSGWGKSQFISNENLYRTTAMRQFLKDNCLFFQITKVKTQD